MSNVASSLNRQRKRTLSNVTSSGNLFGIDIGKPFRTGRTQQAELQKQQQKELASQSQRAKAGLAEAESEVAKRRFGITSKRRGRSLLVATSQAGTDTLGGA